MASKAAKRVVENDVANVQFYKSVANFAIMWPMYNFIKL